jgi:hypothetical protein
MASIPDKSYAKRWCETCKALTWQYREGSCSHGIIPQVAPDKIIVLGGLKNRQNELTERDLFEIRRANKLDRTLWETKEKKEREAGYTTSIPLSDEDAMDIFGASPEVAAKDPSKLYCSFCGSETDEITCLRGSGQTVIQKDIRITGDDPVQIEDVVKVRAKKVIACKDCVLKVVKPQVATRV